MSWQEALDRDWTIDELLNLIMIKWPQATVVQTRTTRYEAPYIKYNIELTKRIDNETTP